MLPVPMTRLLNIEVLPVPAPMLIAVPAPAIFSVVTLPLNKLAVVLEGVAPIEIVVASPVSVA